MELYNLRNRRERNGRVKKTRQGTEAKEVEERECGSLYSEERKGESE